MKLALILSMVGSFICLFLSPIQSYIWNGESSPGWILNIQKNIVSFLEFRVHYFPKESDYYFFGRLFFPTYIGILFGLVEIGKSNRIPENARKEFRILFILFCISAFGNFLAYWIAGFFGEIFRTIGFRLLEAPALFLVLIVSGLLGKKILKQNRWEGISFLSLPFFILGSVLVLRYLPHGALVPVSLLITALLIDSSSWFTALKRQLIRFGSGRTIFFLFLATMLCSGIMQALERFIPTTEEKGLPLKMDFRPFSTISDFQEVFGIYREPGRILYLYCDLVDMIFPIPLFLCIGAVGIRFFSRVGIPTSLAFIPLGFLVFDILENTLMIYHLNGFPNLDPTIASFTGVITAYKLFFLLCSFIIFIISLIGLPFVFRNKPWKA